MDKCLGFIFLLFLSSELFAAPNNSAKPPNVILIFIDDMGYGDLSCYGALDYHTPNLDRMAANGIRFTNFLSAQAVCSASRAALLTGTYPNRIGITGALFPDSEIGISDQEMTIAEMLKQSAYATGIFGKWHLGVTEKFLPLSHGFDEYLGIPYSNDMWPVEFDGMPSKPSDRKFKYPPLPLIRNNSIVDTIGTLDDQGMLTQRLTDEAIGFIKRNRKKPFFAYIPFPMMHIPIYASPEFQGKTKQGIYGDVVQELDHNIGRILETLANEGLDENTLVMFTSDNGPWLNFGEHAGSAGGFREGKGTSFEGGQRVPFLVQWKGTIPAGLVCNQLSSTIDLLPTLAALTGAKLSANKIDGVDISTLFTGNMTDSPRREFLYYYKKNSLEAVRFDNWKLVFAHSGRSYKGQEPGQNGFPGKAPEVQVETALYDLRRDPSETYDVKAFNPEIVKRLLAIAETARADLGDDLQERPGANKREPGKLNE